MLEFWSKLDVLSVFQLIAYRQTSNMNLLTECSHAPMLQRLCSLLVLDYSGAKLVSFRHQSFFPREIVDILIFCCCFVALSLHTYDIEVLYW